LNQWIINGPSLSTAFCSCEGKFLRISWEFAYTIYNSFMAVSFLLENLKAVVK
jgi:hypothetical protein